MVGTISAVRSLEILAANPTASGSRCTCSGKRARAVADIVPLSRMRYAAGNLLSNGLKVVSSRFSGSYGRILPFLIIVGGMSVSKTNFLTSSRSQENRNIRYLMLSCVQKLLNQFFSAK